ncbi:MAG: outer membrane beta-barrel protein [bacterium]
MHALLFFFLMSIGILSAPNALSQGFDWMYSWNSPNSIPKTYIGGYANKGISHESIQPSSFTELVSCCEFGDGSGSNYSFGLTGEYWIDGLYSLQAFVGFGDASMHFESGKKNDSILVFQNEKYTPKQLSRYYTLDHEISSFDLGLIGKTRIASTHFSIATGLALSVLTAKSTSITTNFEIDYPSFSEDFSEEEKRIPSDITLDVTSVLLRPMIRCEYDLAIARGTYCKPFIQADYTLNSRSDVTNGDSWRSLTVLGGISILFGYK